jgi:hypothetical protein
MLLVCHALMTDLNHPLEPTPTEPRTGAKLTETLDMEVDKPADLFFNMSTNGPTAHIASFMDPVDREAFLHVNKNLRYSSLFFHNKAFRIPFELPRDELRLALPALRRVSKIIVTVNVRHLEVLKDCPELRNLVVEDDSEKLEERFPMGEGADYDESCDDLDDEEENISELEDGEIDERQNDINYEMDGYEGGGEEDGYESDETVHTVIKLVETEYLNLDLRQTMDAFMEMLSTFHNLTTLKLNYGRGSYSIMDNGVLAPLTQLVSLDMSNICNENTKALVGMRQLQYLDLSGLDVMDIDDLSELHERVRDLSFLNDLPNLVVFGLQHSYELLADLSPLATLIHLTELNLSHSCRITDPNGIEALRGLTKMTILNNLDSATNKVQRLTPGPERVLVADSLCWNL